MLSTVPLAQYGRLPPAGSDSGLPVETDPPVMTLGAQSRTAVHPASPWAIVAGAGGDRRRSQPEHSGSHDQHPDAIDAPVHISGFLIVALCHDRLARGIVRGIIDATPEGHLECSEIGSGCCAERRRRFEDPTERNPPARTREALRAGDRIHGDLASRRLRDARRPRLGHGEAPRAPRDEGPHSLGAVDLEEQARAAALTPALTASIARPQALSALATGRASS